MLSKSGRFKEACERFSQSDQLKHTFGTAVNLGECAERDGHVAQAWQLYDDAAHTAERTGARELAKFARERASALAPKLCTVVVRIADPTVPGLKILVRDRTLAPVAEAGVLVEPGTVSVTIDAATGAPLHQNLACAAGAITYVRFPQLSPPVAPDVPVSAPVPAPAPVPVTEPAIAPAPLGRDDAAPEESHTSRNVAIGIAIAGGAVLATGAVLGVLGLNRDNDAHALCQSDHQACNNAIQANDLLSSSRSYMTGANIAFGVGGALAITAGVVWLAGRHTAPSVAIAPVASSNQFGFAARGSF